MTEIRKYTREFLLSFQNDFHFSKNLSSDLIEFPLLLKYPRYFGIHNDKEIDLKGKKGSSQDIKQFIGKKISFTVIASNKTNENCENLSKDEAISQRKENLPELPSICNPTPNPNSKPKAMVGKPFPSRKICADTHVKAYFNRMDKEPIQNASFSIHNLETSQIHKTKNRYIIRFYGAEQRKQRTIRSILNRLTVDNLDKLIDRMKEVKFNSIQTLDGLIHQILTRAILEPQFCKAYANFSLSLTFIIPCLTVQKETVTFKRCLLNKCQEEFEKIVLKMENNNNNNMKDAIKRLNCLLNLTTEEKKEEEEEEGRRRMKGIVCFIGEGFILGLFVEKIMHECVKKLLGTSKYFPEEKFVESLYLLMKTIGFKFDKNENIKYMDAYMHRMEIFSNSKNLSLRHRFMLKDLVDIRQNNWNVLEGSKMIKNEPNAVVANEPKIAGYGPKMAENEPKVAEVDPKRVKMVGNKPKIFENESKVIVTEAKMVENEPKTDEDRSKVIGMENLKSKNVNREDAIEIKYKSGVKNEVMECNSKYSVTGTRLEGKGERKKESRSVSMDWGRIGSRNEVNTSINNGKDDNHRMIIHGVKIKEERKVDDNNDNDYKYDKCKKNVIDMNVRRDVVNMNVKVKRGRLGLEGEGKHTNQKEDKKTAEVCARTKPTGSNDQTPNQNDENKPFQVEQSSSFGMIPEPTTKDVKSFIHASARMNNNQIPIKVGGMKSFQVERTKPAGSNDQIPNQNDEKKPFQLEQSSSFGMVPEPTISETVKPSTHVQKQEGGNVLFNSGALTKPSGSGDQASIQNREKKSIQMKQTPIKDSEKKLLKVVDQTSDLGMISNPQTSKNVKPLIHTEPLLRHSRFGTEKTAAVDPNQSVILNNISLNSSVSMKEIKTDDANQAAFSNNVSVTSSSGIERSKAKGKQSMNPFPLNEPIHVPGSKFVTQSQIKMKSFNCQSSEAGMASSQRPDRVALVQTSTSGSETGSASLVPEAFMNLPRLKIPNKPKNTCNYQVQSQSQSQSQTQSEKMNVPLSRVYRIRSVDSLDTSQKFPSLISTLTTEPVKECKMKEEEIKAISCLILKEYLNNRDEKKLKNDILILEPSSNMSKILGFWVLHVINESELIRQKFIELLNILSTEKNSILSSSQIANGLTKVLIGLDKVVCKSPHQMGCMIGLLMSSGTLDMFTGVRIVGDLIKNQKDFSRVSIYRKMFVGLVSVFLALTEADLVREEDSDFRLSSYLAKELSVCIKCYFSKFLPNLEDYFGRC